MRWITAKKAEGLKGNNTKDAIQLVILDMSSKWLRRLKCMQLSRILYFPVLSYFLWCNKIVTYGRFDQH